MIGLAFVLIIFIYMYLFPLPLPSYEGLDGSEAVLTGSVDEKEYRTSYGEEILIIYLKNVHILNPEQTEKNIKNDEENIEYPDINGVMCYMKESPEKGREPRLGSLVKVSGRFKAFAHASNPGEFDAADFYAIRDIQLKLQNGRILKESKGCDDFRETLWKLRKYFCKLADMCFKEDANLIKAMLFGEKSELDEEIKQLYQLNGVIHILSISGLHISIIGMGLHKLLKRIRCPVVLNVTGCICFMYAYGVMTGMSVSAVRAIMMFSVNLAARIFGRTYDMLTAMSMAGMFILAGQPLYLRHSGFLFSFGAIMAIGLFLPVVEENLFGETKIEKVLTAGFSITVVTFPVYLCFYYEYPLYSVFLNLIIIPFTTLIVACGLVSMGAAMIYLPLGQYAAIPARLCFDLYEVCCSFTLKLPQSRSILGQPDDIQLVVYIIIIAMLVIFSSKLTKLQFWQWVIAAFICITLRFAPQLEITMLDVGQGDGIYISEEKGGKYFIDGGSSSQKDVGTYRILPFLKAKGVTRLNALFITHMDSDHYNGVAAVIEDMGQGGIAVENLIMPDLAMKSRNETYNELVAMAKAEGVKVLYIHEGEIIRHGKFKLTCLHPNEKEECADTNEASIVLYMQYESFSALFTGDLEGDGETEVTKILKKYDNGVGNLNLTLLKVAHHGSRNSTFLPFLEAAAPRIALISAGKDNSYGHPHTETIKRLENAGCRIYRTDEGGAITVTYDNGRVGVESFLEAE